MARTAPSSGVRDQLLAAAEALFAERGIDGVSLREINVAAGARNASAVQYHFGDRGGLLRALIERHRPGVEARRHAMLDDALHPGPADVRSLVAALVLPLAAELDEPGGPGYLQVLSDLANRPHPAIDPASIDDPADSVYRWRAAVEPLLSPEAVVLHRRFVAIRFTLAELARRTRDRRGSSDVVFVDDLIDLVSGLLVAPVSAQTAGAMAERRRARGGAGVSSAGADPGPPAPA